MAARAVALRPGDGRSSRFAFLKGHLESPPPRRPAASYRTADPRTPWRTWTLWKPAEAETCAVVRAAGVIDLTVTYRGAARITDNRIINCRKPA